MNIGHISGGTHAGWRRVKEAPKSWACSCGPKPGYLISCPDCKKPRP